MSTIAAPSWQPDWNVGVGVWIDRAGQIILGEGRGELLAAIGRLSSISAAAKAMHMSYRHAWSIVQEVNAAAGRPLVESAAGGRQEGGAKLTPHGTLVVEIYEQLRTELQAAAAGVLRRIIAPATADCIHLVAAISLQDAVGQLLTEYSLLHPAVTVRAVYGASDELADHLLAGSPGDLFLSADDLQLDRLEAAGLLNVKSRRNVAENGLAVIGRSGAVARRFRHIQDLEKVERIALAQPNCPLGNYSQSFLQVAGLYDVLLPKLLHVDNSRSVLSAVQSGAADVGLAFTSDAARAGDYRILFQIDPKLAAMHYAAAVVRSGRRALDAQHLLDFMRSRAGQECFRRYGLHTPRTRKKTERHS